jgi:hypothetical protein
MRNKLTVASLSVLGLTFFSFSFFKIEIHIGEGGPPAASAQESKYAAPAPEYKYPSPQPQNVTGKWVVILCGNASFDNAQEFARKVEKYQPTMYFRNGLYRTIVGPYTTKESAIQARDSFRLEIMSDAYVENLDTWCKSPEMSGGIFKCK